MTDLELLRRYASSKSEDAFTELVRKYTGLVYAAALRQIADAGEAEEITQAVFVILAQKAAALPINTVLSAWLLRTTRYVAMNARRKRMRRPQTELIDPDRHVTETDGAWKSIAPLLDESLLALSQTNRNAISMRFFDGRSFREIGHVMGISDDAAQKRVSRALDELRRSFARRGLALSATLVVGALGAHAVKAAPAQLISAIAASAGHGVAHAGNIAALARLASEAMNAARRRLMMFRVGVGAIVVLLVLLGLRWFIPSTGRRPVLVLATQPANQNPANPPATPANPVAAAASAPPIIGPLLLRVVDSGTDAPVPNARVIAEQDAATLNETTTTNITDQNGLCSLVADRAPREEWGFYVEILADRYAAQFVNWSWERGDETADPPTDYKVRMVRGATVGGVVVDERGDPIPGAAVTLSLPRSDTTHPIPREHEGLVTGSLKHEEITDGDGCWHCAHLPPQFDGLSCQVAHSNFISRSFGMTKLATTSGEGLTEDDFRVGTARIVLQAGFVATGSVANQDGKPITGAKVFENKKWNDQRATYETDEDGRFRLANLPAGEAVITVQAENYLPSDATIHPETENKDLQFTLAPAARLAGRVVDEAGAPLHALVIAVGGDYGSDRFDWHAMTDGEGKFAWLSAPSSEMLYQIQSQGCDLVRSTNLFADGSEQLIVMHRSSRQTPFRISGTVTDEQTGQSISDFQVWMGGQIGIPGPPRMHWSSTFGPMLETTGNAGKFTFPMDRYIRTGPLENLTLQIRAPGYVMNEFRVPGPVTNDRSLNFKLRRSGLISGLVVTPDGKSAPGADVVGCAQYETPALPTPAIIQMNVPGELDLRHTSRGVIQAKSDAEGRFTLVSVPPPKQIIVGYRAGFAAMSMDEFSVSNIITLQPWCRVNGVLKIGNRPAANETVLLSNGTLSPRSSGLWLNLKAVTDSDGHFALENVPPGRWEIGHQLNGGRPGPIVLTQLRTIDLPPGKTVQVALGGEGWKLIGTLKPKRENTWEQHHPELKLKSSAAEPVRKLYAPVIEANGAFTIDDVPPGTYELEAVEMGPIPGAPVSSERPPFAMSVPLANCRQKVTLPEPPAGSESPPFDLGDLELQPLVK